MNLYMTQKVTPNFDLNCKIIFFWGLTKYVIANAGYKIENLNLAKSTKSWTYINFLYTTWILSQCWLLIQTINCTLNNVPFCTFWVGKECCVSSWTHCLWILTKHDLLSLNILSNFTSFQPFFATSIVHPKY